ncbi:uncharacterized protein LOC108095707 isoform X2 [Drosophila ficusphila]|uniref:uncharacterized protein LOC108095707 isoform X2 n=1 Tax=Drosophila ficusphila TaxID=30025 RepID=UPI0007E5C7D2|nr:uncharacterized protein LOC108095707 isoform X2 [Drosophila ficusphila]
MTSNQVPDWVTQELFEDVLKSNVEGYSKIRSFRAGSGTAPGKTYMNVMLRVHMEVEIQDGTTKQISYMVKLPHQSKVYEELMKHTDLFGTERTMFKEVVPEMEALYKAAGLDVTFGAKSYDLKNAKTKYLAMEDLCTKGFKIANRLEGLDQEHTERALRKLAQWHAASAVRISTKGHYPETLLKGFYMEENRPIMLQVTDSNSQLFLKCCKTYDSNEAYIDKIKALRPVLIDEMFKLAQIDTTDFNVINHGDFWTDNIMFQYDDSGKIKEVYLVDFQVVQYGSVAQDLYSLLISSTKLEDKLSKFDHYIKVYHDSLVEHLKILNYPKPIPSLREMHQTMFKYGLWGYNIATGLMCAVLADPKEGVGFEEFESESDEGLDLHMQMYNNARYRKHIQAILPWLLHRGALDMS